MLLVSKKGLSDAKELIASYKQGKIGQMTPELWHAKRVIDSTLHPGAHPIYELRTRKLAEGY
jgi:hypothetical protein